MFEKAQCRFAERVQMRGGAKDVCRNKETVVSMSIDRKNSITKPLIL